MSDTRELRASYGLGMPQLLMHGLSERWLLAECGDLHWRMLCEDLQVDSGKVVDAAGERLYATFLRVRFECSSSFADYVENDRVELRGQLSRFRNNRFFSSFELDGRADARTRVRMATVFVSRASNNKSLSRATPEHIENSTAEVHEVTPVFNTGYRRIKARAFEPSEAPEAPELSLAGHSYGPPRELATLDYTICPYTDLNGVGLLYFASYPRISDVCEREAVSGLVGEGLADWALVTSPVGRDVFYYGNVDAGDRVRYRLLALGVDERDLAYTWSRLERADGSAIADLFARKRVMRGAAELRRRLAAGGST